MKKPIKETWKIIGNHAEKGSRWLFHGVCQVATCLVAARMQALGGSKTSRVAPQPSSWLTGRLSHCHDVFVEDGHATRLQARLDFGPFAFRIKEGPIKGFKGIKHDIHYICIFVYCIIMIYYIHVGNLPGTPSTCRPLELRKGVHEQSTLTEHALRSTIAVLDHGA